MEIISNGSKWAGEAPDDLDALMDRLATCTLDPTFEKYGNFIHEEDGTLNAFGNFYDYSHVFNIRGTYDELRELEAAIRANQATEAYAEARRERGMDNA